MKPAARAIARSLALVTLVGCAGGTARPTPPSAASTQTDAVRAHPEHPATAQLATEPPRAQVPEESRSAAQAPALPYDANAFALVCLWSRATGEAANEWRLFGCPVSPAALPPSLRPRAFVRRLPSYTTQVRVDLEFDESGRPIAMAHTFERAARRRVVYEWRAQDELAGAYAEGADRALATAYRREGDGWVGEQPGVRRTFVPAPTGRGSFEQIVENSSGRSVMRWSLAIEGRSHVARCVDGCTGGFRRVELSFDEVGRPARAQSSLSPAIGADELVFLWRDERLVGVDAMTGDMEELQRVTDVVW